MLRKISLTLVFLFVFAALSGCAQIEAARTFLTPETTESPLPGMMVESVDVSIIPYDPDYQRHYQTQQNLNAILSLLRDMVTSDLPPEPPSLDGGQTYYAFTANYASGEQQRYYLLGYRFLKVGDEPWCEVRFENAMLLTSYLREHPSDDGSVPTDQSIPPREDFQSAAW